MAARRVPAGPGLALGEAGASSPSAMFAATSDSPPATVMVVDDEPAVRSALERALRIERYDVRLASDGREALALIADRSPDAIVLDVAMPDVDGLEVCRRLRAAGDRTPVLMLTARDAVDDRVAGLDAGADDYLVKPFALRELQARLRALLRRTQAVRAGVLRFADLELDPAAREVRRGGPRGPRGRPRDPRSAARRRGSPPCDAAARAPAPAARAARTA